MSEIKVITTEKAPRAIGPYSIATTTCNLVFTSGQGGLDPQTGKLVPGGIEAETRQTLSNIRNILDASGSSMNHVLKTTVFMCDISDFSQMNAVYAEFFPGKLPARSTVQVAALPLGAAVEIEAIACLAK